MLKDRLVPRQRIEDAVATLAEEINADLEQRDPVFICVLKGAVYFFAALTQKLNRSVVVDFIQASSYGATTVSSGSVTLVKDITVDISNKDVYLVEDIVDTGLTLAALVALLRARPALDPDRDAAVEAGAAEDGAGARLRRPRDRGPLRRRLRP